jgi:uncharacterized OsmC-like protein
MATQPTPIVVTHERGLRFAASIRSHTVVTDQPQKAGGEDSAPTPLELLGASLGSCIALYVQQFCHARGLRYDGLRVEVEQHGAPNPSRITRFAVRVVLPEQLPPAYVGMLERVARSCPAHNTLRAGCEIDVRIDAGVTTASAA